MTQRSRRLRTVALLAVPAAVLLAACGATNAPLKVGVRDVATTLLLGAGGKATVQAPVPPIVVPTHTKPTPHTSAAPPPVQGFTPPASSSSSVVTSSAPPTHPASTSSSPVDTCPAGDPLAVPALPAPSNVQFLPTAGEYTELVTGSVTKGSTTVDLPNTAKWAVGTPTSDWTGSYTFDQSVVSGSATTTTTYRVVPQLNSAPNQLSGAPIDPGVYIASVGGTGTTTFTPPDPGLELAAFPLRPGATVTSSATAGTVTMSYTATVKGLETVNACGTPLAAWEIDLTDGTITDTSIPGPDGTQTFTATYAIGTQFGGIVLASSSKINGTDGGVPVTRTIVTAPTESPKVGTSGPAFACLPPDPTTPPVDSAPASPTGAVQAATLAYRSVSVLGTGSTTRTRLPWDAGWQVTPRPDGSYVVHRVTDQGTSDMTFLVGPAGIYLVSFDDGDGTFTAPAPGLQLASFPLTAGARLTGVQATDGTASVTYNSVVAGHASVGTCDGHNLDSWEIDLTGGKFTDSVNQTTMSFSASFFVGTQYGGLILSQTARASGTTLLPAPPSTTPTPSPSGSTAASSSASVPSGSATPSGGPTTPAPPVPTRVQLQLADTIVAQPK